MAKITAVIIRRSNDENTVAIVTAECDSARVQTTDELRAAIGRAVTNWCAAGEGADLLSDNNGNVNIGDLATIDDPALTTSLAAEGVTDLTVNPVAAEPTSWDYDDNLYTPHHD